MTTATSRPADDSPAEQNPAEQNPADGASGEKPLRKDAARNRAALIASARVVFAERGLDASMDDVAKHAGVGVGTAYRHFANKQELAAALLGEVIEEMIAAAHRALEADDPWDGLVGFLETSMRLQAGDRGLRQVMLGVHTWENIDRLHERFTEPVTRMVERAQRAGRLRADVTSTDVGAIFLMLGGILDAFGDDHPELWERYFGLLVDGLRAGSATPLPVAAIGTEEFTVGIVRHKQAGQTGHRC